MSTLYVDNLAPNLGSQVEIPNLKPLAGSVVQVIQTVKTNSTVTTSTTYIDSGLTATITPISSNSKILVCVAAPNASSSTGDLGFFQLQRNGSVIVSNTDGGGADTADSTVAVGGQIIASNNRQNDPVNIMYLDSPSTTSATIYKVQMKTSGQTVTFNRWTLNTDKAAVATITLMEIAQ